MTDEICHQANAADPPDQDAGAAGAGSTLRSVASVVVPVSDQNRALAFYRDILGFVVRIDTTPAPGMRWIELIAPEGPTSIALAQPRGGMWDTLGRDTNISLNSTDIDAEHARLHACGVDVDDHVLRLGAHVPPLFRLRDPDRNTLQIIQSGPVTA